VAGHSIIREEALDEWMVEYGVRFRNSTLSMRIVLDLEALSINSQLLIVVGLKLSSDGDGGSLGMWGSLGCHLGCMRGDGMPGFNLIRAHIRIPFCSS
jgi:hypothetical protein